MPRVRFTASQTVRYDQTLDLEDEEWERFKQLPPDEAASFVENYLDLHDVCDADPVEDDFEAEVVDEAGKPATPPDRYNWL